MNLTGRPPHPKTARPAVVPALRNASRGQDCTLRVPGVCRNDPEYTVGAHLRFFGFAGISQKPDDVFILDACDRCHAMLDARQWPEAALGWDDVLRAFMTTLQRRRMAGLIHLGKESA